MLASNSVQCRPGEKRFSEKRFRRSQGRLASALRFILADNDETVVLGEDSLFDYLARKSFPDAEFLAACQAIVHGHVLTVVAVPVRYWKRPGSMRMLDFAALGMKLQGRTCVFVSQRMAEARDPEMGGSKASAEFIRHITEKAGIALAEIRDDDSVCDRAEREQRP